MPERAPLSAAQQLAALADNYWEDLLRLNPRLATFIGDRRFDDRLEDVGPQGRQADATLHQRLLRSLEGIARADLDADDAVTWDMLNLAASDHLEEQQLRLDHIWVDQMDGPQVWLPDLLNWHPTESTEGLDQLVARYQAFPEYMQAYLANLAEGQAQGRTAYAAVVERVVGQLQTLLDTPASASPLARVALDSGRAAVAEAVRTTIYPAYAELLHYLQGDYASQARTEPGLWAIPGGEEAYAFLCRKHTTTTLTPREIHAFGEADLANLHAEMHSLLAEIPNATADLRATAEHLFSDPAHRETDRARMVQLAERSIADAQAALPSMLGRLPVTPCIVKPVEDFREADSPSAFYYPPSASGDRPGVFYVNCFLQATQPAWEMPGIAFHEAVPGHHVQIALAQERTDLPAFRRLSSDMTAYVEGWALYTERLADEFGLYRGPYERLAMLINQAWRACRLIIDTGLHQFRWGRQRAINFLRENAFLSEANAANEVDRYIIIPGQALSYKIGQREIETARASATTRLGSAFDLRAFHDEVLRYGPIPLSTLRQALANWNPAQEARR